MSILLSVATLSNLDKEIRMPNRTILNESFSPAIKDAVWKKSKYLSGAGFNELRLDACGARMKYGAYGDCSGESNDVWEIDHIKPLAKGGTDDLSNLQALHWSNNRKKSDNYPITPSEYCAVEMES